MGVCGWGLLGMIANRFGVSFRWNENVLRLNVVVIVQLCEFTKVH